MKLHHHPEYPNRPCAGQHHIYDTLIDYDTGRHFRIARKEAIQLCGNCPLAHECFTDADTHHEAWHHTIRATIRHQRDGDAA